MLSAKWVGAPDYGVAADEQLELWLLPCRFPNLVSTLFNGRRRSQTSAGPFYAPLFDHLWSILAQLTSYLRCTIAGCVVDYGRHQRHCTIAEHACAGNALMNALFCVDLAD